MGVWGVPHPHKGHKRKIGAEAVTTHLADHKPITAAHQATGHHHGGNHTNHHHGHTGHHQHHHHGVHQTKK